MSDEHMMLMSQGAIDALEDQAFDEGFKKGREETDFDWRLVAAQHNKLGEILEAGDGRTLMDAAEQLGLEVRAHREVAKIAANSIERWRVEAKGLCEQLDLKEQQAVSAQLFWDKERSAMADYITQLQGVVEPQQQKIKELSDVINDLRQALLKHVKETSINDE